MMRLPAFALLVALVSAPALAVEAPAQFDLICSGTTTGQLDPREPRIMDAAPKRWAQAFRVDLTAKRFCRDDCAKLETLTEGESGQVVLVDDISLIDRQTRESHSAVYDRSSRKYRASDTIQDLSFGFYRMSNSTTATCTAGPFSGFPGP